MKFLNPIFTKMNVEYSSQSEKKSNLNIHWKDWYWISNTLTTWCKEWPHWKRPWWWERLKAGGEGDNRGWDVWMASLTWWLWVWASSRSWTGKPGVLQCMGLQRVGHDIATELNWRWNSSCMTAQSQDTGSLLHLELNWNISFWVSVLQHSDWTTSSTLLSNGTSWDLSASITTWSNSFFVINLSIFFSFSS